MADLAHSKLARVGGFTLVEALAALVIFSLLLSVLVASLIHSQRASAADGRLMRAALLAAEGLEEARQGEVAPLDDGIFRRTVVIGAPDARGLQRADATVRWKHPDERSLRLSTMLFVHRGE